MIFKKPYGFLIKRFRIIHIILTLLTIYIAISTRGILTFIRTYIDNGFSVTVFDNMASQYISGFVYVAIILVMASLLAIFILLRSKKKPNKIYIAAIIYYFILLIAVIIASFLIDSLSEALWPTATALTYRDIAQIIYYPQFIFIFVLAIRALGFNVKQFDFKSDLKELEITDADSEEIELNINFETYKAERLIRRVIRELYYYYLENKLIVNIIFGVIIVITVFSLFKSYERLRYTYDEGEAFTYNNFRVNVVDSMLTNVSASGDEILDGRYYLVLKLEITNNGLNNAYLDYNNLKIYVNNEYVNPSLDIGNYFLDFGDPFMGDRFDPDETTTYTIPYILTEDQVEDEYRLSIYTGASQNSKEFLAITINVDINPTRYMDVSVVREANIGETVSFSSTLLNNTNFTLNSIEIARRYEYQYESCYLDNCRTYTGLVLAGTATQPGKSLLIMDYDFVMDSETSAYQNIKTIKDFIRNFATVEYTILGETYEASVSNVTPSRVEDKLILQTTEDIETAGEVNLLFTIRNRCYKIRIK